MGNPQLHRIRFRAMGCQMVVWLVASEPELAQARLQASNVYFNVAEQELSRFRSDSGLSRLNSASGHPVNVSPMLWGVLSDALEAARAARGLYDPTILNALVSAGYSGSFENIGCLNIGCLTSVPFTTRVQSRWEDIQLDQESLTVTLPPGTGIDLGGIAKGWTAQQVARDLSLVGPCLVDAGGDISVVGRPPGMDGWPIGVADPLDPDNDLAVLSLQDRGVATSGIEYRRWYAGGSRQHHIIDPRSGRPAQTDLLAVTVIAEDGVQAEIHAKVALILGARLGWVYLKDLPSVEGILVLQDGSNAATPGLTDYLLDD